MTTHTIEKPKRQEYDTIRRSRFFDAYDNPQSITSFNQLCKRPDINIPPSTGRTWLKQRNIQGNAATRRTRKQSTRLGRKSKVPASVLDRVIDQDDSLHLASWAGQVEQTGFNCHPHTLQRQCKAKRNGQRFKKRYDKPISNVNKK